MRKSGRNFIVEYKGSRRQAKAKPTLIWGNLDLGAVTRAVESDSLLPAEAYQDLNAEVGVDLTDRTTVDIVADVRASAELESSRPFLEILPAPEENRGEPGSLADDNLRREFQPAERDMPTKPARRARSAVIAKRKKRQGDLSQQSALFQNVEVSSVELGSDQDIAFLERQNRELKRLLVPKLRLENDRLKSMLRRFGSAL